MDEDVGIEGFGDDSDITQLIRRSTYKLGGLVLVNKHEESRSWDGSQCGFCG
jgi:hypothetical protein